MSWRVVVISSSAKLDYQMGYLVIRKAEINKIHLSEIGTLLIESTAVSLTAALISELIERKIKVIFCDLKRNPNAELVPYYGSHDTSLKVRKQSLWSKDTKDLVWTEIVIEKIRKQKMVLEFYQKQGAELLSQYADEIQPGDVTNREGHAAKVYFNSLFGKDFSRSSDCNINSALNYGYSIILSAFNREIVSNGYITQLGLFHDNMFNPFNLSSDIMEPFRPIIDKCVYKMNTDMFGKEEKMKLVDCLNEEVVINGRCEYVVNAIKIYCKSVLDAIGEGDTSLIRFYEF